MAKISALAPFNPIYLWTDAIVRGVQFLFGRLQALRSEQRASRARVDLVLTFTPEKMRTNPAGDFPADLQPVKARLKATWETGDFGQVAKFNIPEAQVFLERIPLSPGMKVLDAACGTGNLAIIAARNGCHAWGLDIASNLIAQARKRAREESLSIDFVEGDAEAMPFAEGVFDAVVSMYGVMFAPRPERVTAELDRVTRPGGLIAMANWTADGFIGKMFGVFGRHLPAPTGLPSPLLWGDEEVVRKRLGSIAKDLRLTRRMARLCYPFSPHGTVEFFRRFYGPTVRAFESLDSARQQELMRDLVDFQAQHNVSPSPNQTETPAEYLEVQAWKRD